MKQLGLTTIMLVALFSITANARDSKSELYDTGALAARSALPPGAKLVAGNVHKNEFFILASPERARATPTTDAAPSSVEAPKSVEASKIAHAIKKQIATKQKAIHVALHKSHIVKAAKKVKSHHAIATHNKKAKAPEKKIAHKRLAKKAVA